MLEQEIASIIKYVLDSAGNPTPYYHNVPQSFKVPAAYFPRPEITTGSDTLSTYEMSYAWYIKFFDVTTEKAFDIALLALNAIKRNRNLIPLINEQGEPLPRGVRLKDPSIKSVSDGVVQLAVEFVSRRPYDRKETEKMQSFETALNGAEYQSVIITEAMEEALSRYLSHPSE